MAQICKSLSAQLRTEGPEAKVVPLEVNASEGVPFESSGFRGKVLFLNRPDPETPAWPYFKHFEDKMRRFEFRLQGVFLEEPGDNIFFGAEITEVVRLGTALRLTANWVLSVLSLLCSARGISYAYSLDLRELSGGDVIRPHLAFPVVAADAIIVTPHGETPPPLTQAVEAVPLQEKLKVRFNTTDTFTFAYWSKQADFERWEICNMPFGWSSPFASFIGSTPVHLTAYRLKRGAAQEDAHSEARKVHLMSLLFSNSRARPPREDEAQDEAVVKVPGTAPTPAGTRWSLEAAELSAEEMDRLLLDERELEAVRKSEQGPLASAGRSWPWSMLSLGGCSCTTQRHGVR